MGGGFSMSEAIVNDVAVISPKASMAGELHCGKENCVSDLKEYFFEILKMYKDKNYLKEKLEKEKLVQKSLSYEVKIPQLISYIEKARQNFLERREKT